VQIIPFQVYITSVRLETKCLNHGVALQLK